MWLKIKIQKWKRQIHFNFSTFKSKRLNGCAFEFEFFSAFEEQNWNLWSDSYPLSSFGMKLTFLENHSVTFASKTISCMRFRSPEFATEKNGRRKETDSICISTRVLNVGGVSLNEFDLIRDSWCFSTIPRTQKKKKNRNHKILRKLSHFHSSKFSENPKWKMCKNVFRWSCVCVWVCVWSVIYTFSIATTLYHIYKSRAVLWKCVSWFRCSACAWINIWCAIASCV